MWFRRLGWDRLGVGEALRVREVGPASVATEEDPVPTTSSTLRLLELDDEENKILK